MGERLKQLRERVGLTQEQLAERAGVPIGTLRGWEYGRREPLLSAAGELAAALGVEVGELLKPVEQPAEPPSAEKPKRGRPPKAASEGRSAAAPAQGQGEPKPQGHLKKRVPSQKRGE
jgi:transcriptional regulator with XRE-family HTH domain